jgi:hypothetical protein
MGHTYGSITNTMKILKTERKGKAVIREFLEVQE